jgi:uncharacterized protein with GYD domain
MIIPGGGLNSTVAGLANHPFNIVAVMEGSDEAVTTALLQVCSLGNVRTETLRGFSLDDMKKMVGTMP